MDWYSEAKRRQAELLNEAAISRLLMCAEDAPTANRAGVRGYFFVWLGGRLIASGKRLQTQYK